MTQDDARLASLVLSGSREHTWVFVWLFLAFSGLEYSDELMGKAMLAFFRMLTVDADWRRRGISP